MLEEILTLPDLDVLQPWLEKRLTSTRYQHVLGVVEKTSELCQQLALNDTTAHTAQIAALLHDNAKQLPHLAQKLKDYDYELSPLEASMPAVWHAWVGAEEARCIWGIQDEAILNAIRFHTTGRPDMSLVEQLVYVADKTEARTRDQNLVSRWQHQVEDLQQRSSAPLLTCWLHVLVSDSVSYLTQQYYTVHPLTLALQQQLLLTFNHHVAGGSPT